MSNIKGFIMYYPRVKSQIRAFLLNFYNVLVGLGDNYDITPDELNTLQNNNNSLETLENDEINKRNLAQQATQAYNEKLALAETDTKRIIKKIMQHQNFIRSDGEALGILVQSPVVEPSQMKAVISSVNIFPDKAEINWIKNNMHGAKIYCARVSGSQQQIQQLLTQAQNDPAGLTVPPDLVWEALDIDMRSPYDDRRLNLSNQPEVRYYKIRYIYNDEEVGEFSDIVRVVTEIYER